MNDLNDTASGRKRLEELEREIAARHEERRTLLKTLSGERVQDYGLKNRDGSVTRLSEMFGDIKELMLVHNMGRSCPYCTLWADGFNGVAEHLNNRLAFALVSPNPPHVQKEFAESRGWKFTMYSSEGSTFTRDMGYEVDHEGQPYQLPGVSVFTKDEEGNITRTAHDFFGPGDSYAGIWHLFELLPGGPDGWHPRFSYNSYTKEEAPAG